MLNKILKASFMLVFSITLIACNGSKKGTPSGNNNDKISVGGILEIDVSSDLGQAIQGKTEGTFFTKALIRLEQTQNPNILVEKEFLFANKTEWDKGYSFDFTQDYYNSNVGISVHIFANKINSKNTVKLVYYDKNGDSLTREGQVPIKHLVGGVGFPLKSTTGSEDKALINGKKFNQITEAFFVVTYNINGQEYYNIFPPIYINYTAKKV